MCTVIEGAEEESNYGTLAIGRDESDRMSSAYEAAVPPAQEPCSELGEKADRKFVEMQLRALR